jgi:SAM-dependent methyltransferase
MLECGVAWDPEPYMRGNYFQKEVNEAFRKQFMVKPFGSILDIGCGDGQYSSVLANTLKQGHILGIDSSEDMILHANQQWANKNLSFEAHNIEDFHPTMTFDFALSFWCLHWTNIEHSFPNIFHALKNGGRMYAVFSSFSDNSMLQTWQELAKQNRYKELRDRYVNLNKAYNDFFFRVFNILNQLPFKQIKLNMNTSRILFPTIDYFKNLILTMPFINTFPPERIENLIDDMLNAFQNICQRKYGGALYYETRPIFVEALK